jgi:hypothetical protein
MRFARDPVDFSYSQHDKQTGLQGTNKDSGLPGTNKDSGLPGTNKDSGLPGTNKDSAQVATSIAATSAPPTVTSAVPVVDHQQAPATEDSVLLDQIAKACAMSLFASHPVAYTCFKSRAVLDHQTSDYHSATLLFPLRPSSCVQVFCMVS